MLGRLLLISGLSAALLIGCASSSIYDPRPPTTTVASALAAANTTSARGTTGSPTATALGTTGTGNSGSFTSNNTGFVSGSFGNDVGFSSAATIGNSGFSTGNVSTVGPGSIGGGSTTGFGNGMCVSCVVNSDCQPGLNCLGGVCNTRACSLIPQNQEACFMAGGFCNGAGVCQCPRSNTTGVGVGGSTVGVNTFATTGGPRSTAGNRSTAATFGGPSTANTFGGPSSTSTFRGSTAGTTFGGSTAGTTIGGSTGSQLGSCNPTPGWQGNSQGVGAYCSASQPNCPNGLFCAATVIPGFNFCVSLGCANSNQCGDAACCVDQFGMSVCIPSQCPEASMCIGTNTATVSTATNGRTFATATVTAGTLGSTGRSTIGRASSGKATGGIVTGATFTGGTVTGATLTGGKVTTTVTGGTVTGGTVTGATVTVSSASLSNGGAIARATMTGGTITGGKSTGGTARSTVTGATLTGGTTTGGTATGGTLTTNTSGGSTGSELGTCDPTPGWTGNSEGVGAYCATQRDCNKVGTGLVCAVQAGYNFCTLTGCTDDSQCGAAACCYHSSFAGDVCAPVGCGVCPVSGSTASSAVSTGSASTAGSTGTTGSTGTQADCTTLGCSSGETCTQYSTGGPFYNLCACTAAGTNGSADSCAMNTNGLTVCDPDTFQCRFPRDFEPCNTNRGVLSCAPSYFCNQSICLQSCKASTDCTLSFNSCQEFSSTTSVCLPDACGPGSPAGGDFYASCEVDKPSDGFCQPYLYDGGSGGYCYLNGTQGPHQICGGYASRTLGCEANAICYGQGQLLPDGGPDETCYQTCNASTSPGMGEADACPAGKTCYGFQTASGPLDPGSCYP